MFGNLPGPGAQRDAIDLREIGEAWSPEGLVRASEGVIPEEVEVITDQNEITRGQIPADTAGGIQEQHACCAQSMAEIDGEKDWKPTFAFVPVAASAEDYPMFSEPMEELNTAGMTGDGGGAQSRYFRGGAFGQG